MHLLLFLVLGSAMSELSKAAKVVCLSSIWLAVVAHQHRKHKHVAAFHEHKKTYVRHGEHHVFEVILEMHALLV